MDGFSVHIDEDKMYADIRSGDNIPNLITTTSELLEYFKRYKVLKGINNAVIKQAFIELHQSTDSKSYRVAEGKEPENGTNGTIIFNTDVSGKTRYTGFNNDPSKKIDYKSSTSVSTVTPGEIICNITPPQSGRDGYNIEGTALQAKAGKPAELTLGEGIEFNADKSAAIATMPGRPLLLNNRLEVCPEYEVHGNVGYKTGNIKFDGHVHITGSVEDSFTIEAQSLEINGVVGSANICSKSNLIIHGGVNGHHSGKISSKGDTVIKYLNDSEIEVEGDLTVHNAIVCSTVKCTGKLSAGSILGSRIIALKGVEVSNLGAELGRPTEISVGINFKEIAYYNKLAELTQDIDKIVQPFMHHMGDSQFINEATGKVKNTIEKSYLKFTKLYKKYITNLSKIQALNTGSSNRPVNRITVMNKMFSDIKVSTHSCRKHFVNRLDGPLQLSEDSSRRSIVITRAEQHKQDNLPAHSEQDEHPPSHTYSLNIITAVTNKVWNAEINQPLYTLYGIKVIDDQFKSMLNGQNFYIYLYDRNYSKRMKYFNFLKHAGIRHIAQSKNQEDLFNLINSHPDTKSVLICSSTENSKSKLLEISKFISNSSNHYAIVTFKKINKKLKAIAKHIPTLAIFDESVDPKEIDEQLKKFGFSY